MQGLRFKSPAKVNLGLEVLGRRNDGYHEISSIMLAVDLSDEVEVLSGRTAIDAEICEEFRRTTLTDQAMTAYCEKSQINNCFRAGVKKNTPIAAGLGGGSSNAATALSAVNLISGHALSETELADVAGGVGSDVAFFLSGGCALVSGRGEIRERELPVPNAWIVLANPGIELSTPDVFGELRSAEFTAGARIRELADSIAVGRPQWNFLHNGLQPAAERVCPPIRATLDAIRAHTPWTVLSGSGATCFGIFESEEAARAAGRDLARSGYWTWAGRPMGSWKPEDLMI